MNHGSLFSGGGGFDLAAEVMGWRNVFHCEKDTFCQTILKHYWPKSDCITDIGELNGEKYQGKVDILTGGFPCQPFSNAGGRRGTADDRYLWPQMLLLERSSPAGSWLRTYTGLLIGMKGWYSTRRNLIWKQKASKSGRMFCQLLVSTPRIRDTASGSLDLTLQLPQNGERHLIPTPTAIDGTAPILSAILRNDETPENTTKLTAFIKHNWKRLVPTPTAMDCSGSTAKMKSSQVKPGSMHSVTLSRWTAMLPTPISRDHRGGRKPEKLIAEGRKPSNSLPDYINCRIGTTGQLNPRFVAEMMGFPPNWTELPFRNGEPDP